MVETGSHHHNHSHQPPPPQGSLPSILGAAKGPVYPPAEQLLQLQYCIHSNPSWPHTVLLGFQHYIVMLGTTVLIATILVPQMGGSPGDKARVIQSLLFMSGLNTLLQTWFGTRLPTVMGPSLAYLIPVLSIIKDLSNDSFPSEHQRFLHTMRAIQGSLIVSSFINIILGYGRVWGKFTRFFSPVVIVPVLAKCVEIGLPMLVLLVVSQYLKRLHPIGLLVLERYALLICVGLIWAFAAILTASSAYNHVKNETAQSCRIDRSYLLSSAPWIKFTYPFQWGTPIFRASHVFGMMGAALVSTAESTGTFYAAARLAGATLPPSHVLTRSIGLQGIGQLLEGIFGSLVGTTASVENVGLLGLTHVGSRRAVQLSTAFMIFFSIFAAIGISFIQFANNNSMRNIYVLGLSLFLGISIPQYFVSHTDLSSVPVHGPVKTNAGWFNDILNTFFSSPPTVAMIVGTTLDNTFEAHSREERGIPWWAPFQSRRGDSRTEEFYNYPLRINELIPSSTKLTRVANE
ncbi:hypothetical protein HYC85_008555 [Camellia sinensis]|uniref:Nucleobase-ascorbate transporter 3 n=1 Tax=Camellia sinensis TaxID=4442 RepID=A0A7J7HSS3_CAMSI|nr:hypothetical protein HYC85_008555 [Camellia sinensis]